MTYTLPKHYYAVNEHIERNYTHSLFAFGYKVLEVLADGTEILEVVVQCMEDECDIDCWFDEFTFTMMV